MLYCHINWEEIDPLIPELIRAGLTQEEISKKFNISQNSVCRRIVKLGLWHEFEKKRELRQNLGKSVGGRRRFLIPKERLIKRKCLKCRRIFLTDSRYTRLCPECKNDSPPDWQATIQCFS